MLGDNTFIGQSTSLASVFRTLEKVAPTNSTVLVTGESGTGKEVLVRALHQHSTRHNKPFVPINCGAIPKELLESELFGHEKGAFTHAIKTRPGRFEMAEGGTVFLDEIGEMDLLLQVKILRVLQEKEIERVGGQGTKKVDVRIVAATNRDLEKEVAAGTFREDLYYRLNVIPIHLPPLRERNGDILLLAEAFLKKFCAIKQRPQLILLPEIKQVLNAYMWPGNIRELENLSERLSILCDEDTILMEDLPSKILEFFSCLDSLPKVVEPKQRAVMQGFTWPTLADLKEKGFGLKEFIDCVEERLLKDALDASNGVKNQAAELLGIKRTTLIEKLKKKKLD